MCSFLMKKTFSITKVQHLVQMLYFFFLAKREKYSFLYIRQLADTAAFQYKQIVTLYFIQHYGNKALMHDEKKKQKMNKNNKKFLQQYTIMRMFVFIYVAVFFFAITISIMGVSEQALDQCLSSTSQNYFIFQC